MKESASVTQKLPCVAHMAYQKESITSLKNVLGIRMGRCSMQRLHVYLLLFLLTGSTQIDGSAPCSGISCIIGCGKPQTTNNQKIRLLSMATAYRVGTVVRFVCQQGYWYKSGSDRSRCLSNGTWSRLTLSCEARCNSPPSETHTISNRRAGLLYTLGSVVTYWCEEGYSSGDMGEMKLKCTNEGNWAFLSERLVCKKKCEEFNVTNGHVWSTGESVFNTSVEITCQPGYRLLGQGTRMCRDEGIWSGQVPTCMEIPPVISPIAIDCGVPHQCCVNCDTYNGTYWNSTATCRCMDGSHPFYLVCQADGTWKSSTSLNYQCNLSECQKPQIINGTSFLSSTHERTSECFQQYEFRCNDGFDIVGPNKTECSCSGKLVPSIPHCTSMQTDNTTSTSEPISIISSYHEEEKGGEENEEVEEEEISGVLSLQAIVYILSVMAILGLTLATLVLCKGAIKRAIYELMLKIKHPRAVRRVPVLENCEEKSVENAECELTPLSTVSIEHTREENIETRNQYSLIRHLKDRNLR